MAELEVDARCRPARRRCCSISIARTCQAPRALVLPLTGDASDRRYFRVLPRGRRHVRAGAARRAVRVRRAAVRERGAACSRRCRCRFPAILGHADDLGILALQDLGDVTLQAHLGAARAVRARGALPRRRSGSSPPSSGAARELASDRVRPVRHRVRRREADLGARVLPEALRRCLPRRRDHAGRPRGASRRSAPPSSSELAGEPRVLCHRDYHSRNLMLHDGRLLHHRLPGRADGARHLRPRVAAARLLRRPPRGRARRATSPTSWRCRGGTPVAGGRRPSSAGGST